jgi:hypothetical protein
MLDPDPDEMNANPQPFLGLELQYGMCWEQDKKKKSQIVFEELYPDKDFY